MFTKEKISKDKKFRFTEDITVPTRDGRSSILRIRRSMQLRVSTKNSVSISTDHSTLSLNFHSTELLKCMVILTCILRDGETTPDNNNSILMRGLRQSEINTGNNMSLIFKVMEAPKTYRLHNISVLDGGRCST
jgi:hypothetical protein